ncbi:MAG: protein kinase [Candidatus Peregrinibacteria bacterium]|nr:protein kinase [Candidatus Peregrinibacteria bacterium]MCB9807649.1 protein kinase [Candidatus Peribacteria bacterium]
MPESDHRPRSDCRALLRSARALLLEQTDLERSDISSIRWMTRTNLSELYRIILKGDRHDGVIKVPGQYPSMHREIQVMCNREGEMHGQFSSVVAPKLWCARQRLLIMDYIDGVDGHQLLKTLPKERDSVVSRHMLDTAQMIRDVHAAHTVHNDVRCKNVLIDITGRHYLTDFAMSLKLRPREEYRLPKLIDTIEYSSPEKILSSTCGTDGDTFSFGCMLYRAIHPFSYSITDDKHTIEEKISAVLDAEDRVRSTIPHDHWAYDTLMQTLQYSPQERPTMSTVCEQLHDIYEGLPEADDTNDKLAIAEAVQQAKAHV